MSDPEFRTNRKGYQVYGITAPKTHGNYHISEVVKNDGGRP